MPLIQTFSFPAPSSASGRHFRLFSSFPQRPTSFPFPFSTPSQNPQDPHVQPFPFYNPSHNFNVPQFQPQQPTSDDDSDDEVIIGDCIIFEEGAFDQPIDPSLSSPKKTQKKKRRPLSEPEPQDLVPDKWREAVEEINLTKKEKRRIANQLRFGSKMEGRKPSNLPPLEQYKALREMKMKVDPEEYRAYREMKVAKVKPEELVRPEPQSRVVPKNPRLDINGGSLEDINDFFNSSNYINEDKDGDKKREARPKLFTQEEKVILNRRKPDLNIATTSKWMPLHAIAASGEFYLLDKLMIHINDINSVDKDGLTALHRAIIGKKQAIINYLLRNSANPFIRDNDGATLMHYSVQTASSDTIKILLLYNVDINIPDNDGWTPLHLAVQTQRTDIVKLLLIKGADRSLRNNDGLTPLELCLYLGHNVRTYELIKLLKGFNASKTKV